jgi:hypothetical protein
VVPFGVGTGVQARILAIISFDLARSGQFATRRKTC